MSDAARWALVTGGSRGIGRAVAYELATGGWHVAIVHLRNSDAAAAAADEVRGLGRKCLVYQANLAKPDECAAVVRRVVDEGGPLNGLVHAAGLGALSPALATRPSRWQIAWESHVGALLALATAAEPLFADGASIVAFSSLGAWRVMPGYASIATAKGALESAIRYLAAELAPRRVTVNAIRGGPVDTDSLRSFTTFDEIEAESRRRLPGRLGRPEDIAPIAAYLLGPGARWITGQVITADGGSASISMRHYHLDRIESLEPGVRAVGVRAVALSDDVFADHFPGNPVLPGVYLVEGLAQTAGVLLSETAGRSRIAVMVSVDRARFTSFARPGDVVKLSVEIESYDERAARVRGVATVGDRQVAAAALTFSMQEPARVISPLYLPFVEQQRDIWLGRFPSDSDD